MTHRGLRRIATRTMIVIMLTGVLASWAAATAEAHVRVTGTPVAGGYGVLTFRVPTESDTASTVGLTVSFPTDVAFASVSVQPKPGWKVVQTRRTLSQPTDDGHGGTVDSVVASVSWTATDGGIGPGEFDTFALSVGPFPDVATLTFPAVQAYSDGTSVAWTEISQGGAEPEHPAPVVTVAPAPADDSAPSTAPGTEAGPGRGLGIAGIVIAVLALGVAVAALLRTGSRAGRS